MREVYLRVWAFCEEDPDAVGLGALLPCAAAPGTSAKVNAAQSSAVAATHTQERGIFLLLGLLSGRESVSLMVNSCFLVANTGCKLFYGFFIIG
jgi:hypothetical protein